MRLPYFALLLPVVASAQSLTPVDLCQLNNLLNETSGLVNINGHIWTQLDSGNPHRLYNIDTITGQVIRHVTIDNATNVDWEEITTDANYFYVGDFGNNSGDRTDLRVYRFPLAQLEDTTISHITADTIRFAYADQTDFTPANHANNWDCEAFVAMDDSLFLFTKNWLNSESYLYALSAEPGMRTAVRRDTLLSQGLVTGATYDPAHGRIALIGYTTTLSPFVWDLSGFTGHDFLGGNKVRHAVLQPLTQTEGIAWLRPGVVYLSNEYNAMSPPRLWRLQLDIATDVPVIDQRGRVLLSPNPASDTVRVPALDTPRAHLQLIDGNGRISLDRSVHANETIDVSALRNGTYTVALREGMLVSRGKLVIAR